MSATVVDRLHAEFSDLLTVLDRMGEVSLRSVADDSFRKALLMAAASHFELRMKDIVLDFVSEVTSESHVLTWLVRNKAVSRQYHTWFNWESKNANSFFGLFGTNFQKCMKDMVGNDNDLESSIRAFMEVGRERNRLVHQDFGVFTLEKTSEEIYQLYAKAMKFIEWFPIAIRQFSKELVQGDGQHA